MYLKNKTRILYKQFDLKQIFNPAQEYTLNYLF